MHILKNRGFALLLGATVGAFILAVMAMTGHPVSFDASMLGALLIGETAAAVAPSIRRFRDQSFTFENVVAGGKATARIPMYDRSLHRIILELGGTTLTKAYLTNIVVKWGTKKLWEITGSHLDKLNAYNRDPGNDYFLPIDFTDINSKLYAGEFMGALPVGLMRAADPQKQITVEIDISSSASAPTLKAHCTWGPSQSNDLLKRMIQMGYTLGNSGATAGNTLYPDFQGADLARLAIIYAGTDWAASATATAWTGNTGTGTVGTITVSAAAKVGTYKLLVIEPGSNVGQFIVEDPDGNIVSKAGTVASAFSGGGLAFTLSDATDFVSGDGFDILVSKVSDGNVNRVVVQKDTEVVFDRACHVARYEQQEYLFVPQSKLFMVDFTVDRASPDSLLPTADARQLAVQAFCTATDTMTGYAECYQRLSSIR